MAEKEFNTRIVHKHDIQANWEKAIGFIPKQGELIIYDIDENYDYQRIKIGDGVANVNELPFWDKGIEDKLIENAPNLEADRGEPGYIANRPGYRKINKAVNTFIEVVEVGNYCLLDFSTVHESFVNNYLTYEELIRDYNRTYDFYYSLDTVEAETGLLWGSSLVRVGDRIKLLDDINCYINVLISDMTLYIVHNRDLLSEELKEKIPYNGIWLISNQAVDPYGGQIRNFWFREYIYTKFDPNLIPNNVMFKRDMGEYVTQEEMDGAIADLHAVQYTEQTLTDEEQMQARKNLGLYNTSEEPVQFYKGIIDGEYIDGDVERLDLVKNAAIYIGGEKYICKKQGRIEKWSSMGLYWFGNLDLVPAEHRSIWYEDSSETIYKDLPFVIYESYLDNGDTTITSGRYSGDKEYGQVTAFDNDTLVTKITTIPEEYLPDSISNTINNEVVKHTEQFLTEEQQMQARANLGLYCFGREYPLLAEIGPDRNGYIFDVLGYFHNNNVDITEHDSINIEIIDAGTHDVCHMGKYQKIGDEGADYNTKACYRFWYWGNPSLIQNDSEVWQHLDSYIDTTEPSDAPFVLYYAYHEDEIKSPVCRMYISTDLVPTVSVGFWINIHSGSTQVVYNKVPNEYIPIAQDWQVGGIVADPVTEEDTQPVRIDSNGYLYTVPGVSNAVQYVDQTLTDEQKLQARTNINAAGAAMIVARDYSTQTTVDGVTKIKADHTFEEIKAWHDAGGIVLFRGATLMPVHSINSSYIIFIGIHWLGKEPGISKVTIDTDGYTITDKASQVPVPDVGAVGQVMAVKSITSSGKPNAWEPIDLPTQIQADWFQTDETAVDFIKNKPEIATDNDVINALIEADLLCCVADSEGSILTDESENILLW